MKKQLQKERGPWIDIFLVCSIITLGSIIFYFTVIQEQEPVYETSASAVEEPLQTDITEHTSPVHHVSFIHMKATHSVYPFDLQYPKTKYITVNEEISAYITDLKDAYINEARHAQNAGASVPGNLQVQTQIYTHLNRYYSFVLTATEQQPNGEKSTSMKTFFLDHTTGQLLTLAQLFNNDAKSLQTFVSHIQSEILAISNGHLSSVQQNFSADWHNFKHFALHDEELILYFTNKQFVKEDHPILPIAVSLSYLNPLLDEPFQTAMAEVTTEAQQNDTGNTPDTEKRIALTFDDGPHPEVTPKILSILEKYSAKATFYVLGTRVTQSPEIVKQAFDAGHEIGNHTWSHPKLPKLSSSQIESEFQTTEDVLLTLLGEPTKTFRPPYGMTNDFVESIVPIQMVHWSIDTEDWRHRNPQMLLPSVQDTLHNNAIVLMHDIHQSTAEGLESVLAYLQKEGYTFVTVSEILTYHE